MISILPIDKESTLYSVNGTSVKQACETWPVLLGLPGTAQLMELQVHLPALRKMWTIEIMRCKPDSKALLCILCAAVRYLCNKQIQTEHPPSPIPFNQVDTYSILKRGRVYHNTSTGFVHKIFEKGNDATDPNTELLRAVGLKDVQKEDLTTDGEYFQVKYKYMYIGVHSPPSSLKKYAGVTECLYKVHQLGCVHGDIRCANIIFSETDDKSYLIDFDLARTEGSSYPSGYNVFSVRHSEAREGNAMLKDHDRYSLAKIIRDATTDATNGLLLISLQMLLSRERHRRGHISSSLVLRAVSLSEAFKLYLPGSCQPSICLDLTVLHLQEQAPSSTILCMARTIHVHAYVAIVKAI